jgi:hypothetical protein
MQSCRVAESPRPPGKTSGNQEVGGERLYGKVADSQTDSRACRRCKVADLSDQDIDREFAEHRAGIRPGIAVKSRTFS